MARTEYIFEAGSLYREFRERMMKFGVSQPAVIQHGISIHKIDFISNNFGCLLAQDQREVDNIQFPYVLFLPDDKRQFDEALIILNGLNESEYRKFFPWAASLAASGIPTIIFPIAFLINRRPRRWFIPKEVEKKLEVRRKIEQNSVCAQYNVILSERLEKHPERFFLAGLETYRDLLDLGHLINSGEHYVKQKNKTLYPFIKGARTHFLGYSLGGYLALILLIGKKEDPIFSQSKLIIFCSGAAINNLEPELNANPISPLILDKSATERLTSFYRSGERFPFMDTEEALVFKAVFLSEKDILIPEIKRLKSRIKIVGSENDRVIPIRGIEKNLGWVDEDLRLGIHEYPFNVENLEQPNLEREMAGSYNVANEFQVKFKKFIDCVVDTIRE